MTIILYNRMALTMQGIGTMARDGNRRVLKVNFIRLLKYSKSMEGFNSISRAKVVVRITIVPIVTSPVIQSLGTFTGIRNRKMSNKSVSFVFQLLTASILMKGFVVPALHKSITSIISFYVFELQRAGISACSYTISRPLVSHVRFLFESDLKSTPPSLDSFSFYHLPHHPNHNE